jgi:hypothetical protein
MQQEKEVRKSPLKRALAQRDRLRSDMKWLWDFADRWYARTWINKRTLDKMLNQLQEERSKL